MTKGHRKRRLTSGISDFDVPIQAAGAVSDGLDQQAFRGSLPRDHFQYFGSPTRCQATSYGIPTRSGPPPQLATRGTLVEIGAQLLYGSASGKPGRLIEFARLTNLSIRNAGDAPRRLEVVAGERRLCGMFADHFPTDPRRSGRFRSTAPPFLAVHNNDSATCACDHTQAFQLLHGD